MNTHQRNLISELRKLSKLDAANYLITNFPISPSEMEYDNLMHILIVIEKISWDKESRLLLANYYLSDKIFGNPKVYECFLKVMPTRELLMILKNFINIRDPELWLLKYCLEKTFSNINDYSDKEKIIIHNFFEELGSVEHLNGLDRER